METLQRINSTFQNIKCNIKNKNSAQSLANLKKDIQNLNTDLVILGKENNELFIRSLAMEGYLALISAKALPVSLPEKRNMLHVVFDKLNPYSLRGECLFIFLRVQNLLCYYLIQLDQITLARDILERMEQFYIKIQEGTEKYIDAEELFTVATATEIKKVNAEKIDKVITNNIQMQAYLYNKLNLPHKYTIYNHTALRRQLELKEGTPQEWALRTARLGNYFMYLNQVGNAGYHLSAAYHVLRNCHDNCKMIPEEFVLQKADFELHFLELSHYWVKYGLMLFKLSKKKILSKFFTQPTSKDNLWNAIDATLLRNNLEDENVKDCGAEKVGQEDANTEEIYKFSSLDLHEIEDKVPSELVSKSLDARKLFAFTHKWLMRAKNYYDFEHNSSQYISCSLQLAELYEHLAFFEKDLDNQYSIQKRRADVLESLNALLKNCDNVMSVQIDVIRELSQVQLELMTLNLQKLWREESQMNVLSLDNDAESIINSLKSESNKTLTEKTLNASSKTIFLRKMEAATSINGKLFRLCNELQAPTPSQCSVSIA